MVRVGIVGLMFLVAVPARAADPSSEGIEFFEKKVRPAPGQALLRVPQRPTRRSSAASCCSTPATGVLKGGATGPAVVPGEPEKSLLIQAVRHADDAISRCRRRRSCPTPRSPTSKRG